MENLPNHLAHAYIIAGDNKEALKNKAFALADYANGSAMPIDDLIEISPQGKANIIPIDAIRDLIARLSQKPRSAKVKVAIIYEAERLKIEAEQALLKTLEEPPENSFLFLLTDKPEEMLPTIRSRAQTLKELSKNEDLEESEKELWDSFVCSKLSFLLEQAAILADLDKGEQLRHLKSGERYFRDLMISSDIKAIDCLKAVWYSLFLIDRNVNARLIWENLMINIYRCYVTAGR